MYRVFCILFFLFTSLYSDDLYYDVSEYNIKYNQVKKSKAFQEIVTNKTVNIAVQNKEKVKISIVYPGMQLSDYWRRSQASLEKRLQELNINYELKTHFTKPATQINKQAKQLLNAIKNDSDYLIFTLDTNKHTSFIERINSQKKPKLILQNITTPLRKWHDKQPFLYVGFDHFLGSKVLANEFINQTNKKGRYAVIYGSQGYVSYMRGTKFIEYISKNSDLKLVHEYYTNFDKQKAKNATIDLLNIDDNIDFIYACSTDIALGVIEALKEKGYLGKIKVNGWGGGSEEIKVLKKRLLDFTVMRMNDENGIAMAEAIRLDLEGKTKQIPTIYSGSFELIKSNIDEQRLQKLEKRAFRYSNETK